MKLAVCVVHQRDKAQLADEMVKAGFKFTLLASHGGFLREANATFMVGVEEDQIPLLKSVVEKNCQAREQVVNVSYFENAGPGSFLASPMTVPVGGAVIFFVKVDEFIRF